MLIVENTAPQELDVCATELEMIAATFEALEAAMNHKEYYDFNPLAFSLPLGELANTTKIVYPSTQGFIGNNTCTMTLH